MTIIPGKARPLFRPGFFVYTHKSLILSGANYIQGVGIAAGVFTALSLMPQLIKTFKTKKAEEISIGMLVTLMFGIGLWIYYGILRKDLPIIITNSFSFLLNVILVILRWKYKK
ncbi:MAG: SemiSWEET transporter [Ginsengibacter sp.]